MDNFNLKFPNGLIYNCQMKDQSISCTYSTKQKFSSTEIITSDYKPKLGQVVKFAKNIEKSPRYMNKRLNASYEIDCPYRKARELGMKSMQGMDMPCKYNQKDCPYRRGIQNNSGGIWDATGTFNNTD